MTDIKTLVKNLKVLEDKDYWNSVKNKDNKAGIRRYLKLTDGEKDSFASSLAEQNEEGVCGPNRFVKNTISRQTHDYSNVGNLGKKDIDTVRDPCHSCDKPPFKGKTDYGDFKKQSKDKYYPSGYMEYNRMCNKNPLIWYPSQKSEDPFINKLANTASFNIKDNDDSTLIRWITDRIYDDELSCMVYGGDNCGGKSLVNNISDLNCNISDNTGDVKKCKNINELKKKIIHDIGGPTIKCKDMHTNFSDQITKHDAGIKSDRQFSHKCGKINNNTLSDVGYIIPEQYKMWENKQFREKHEGNQKVDFKDLGLSVSPPTTQFETCINDVFSNYDTSKEAEIIKKLHSKDKLSELSKDDLNYLERKLKAFLINSNQEKIKQCIKSDLYEDTTICHAELSEQMAKIIGVILFVIGYKFKDNDLNKPENKRVLLEIIDKFGDLIPRVFEKIIILTESIEKSECNGISDETKMLHNLYKKVFKSGSNVINFDLGISNMIKSATNQEFDRSTILMVLGIAFLKFF